MKYSLTILTPLYNRKKYLDRLFQSLSSQTSKNFQWLVIDDGSTESSHEEFEKFAKDADFPIEYYYKENGGKHTALNYSQPYIKSDWVLILDSDDILTSDAVMVASSYIEKYSNNTDIGIISFLRGHDDYTPFVKFKNEEVISDYIEYRINAERDGDCCEIVRADVLREYSFPVFQGERFMSESHLWIGSADKYKTVYIPKIIYICEYMDDGLTKAGRRFWRTCPKGCLHCHILGLNKRCSLKFRIERALLIHYYGRVLGIKNKDICKMSGHPAFLRFFTIPGIILFHIWEKKYK
ncbi:MAG: glycosyltransferase family 2 protein [Ruminococcaceae bacterium]|nr:glycosyltransferase family 2 protein [Oscillospiraceae bacterium]